MTLAACGDSEDVAQISRHCDLSTQFDDQALGTGVASAPGRYDGPSDAVARLFEQMGATIEELQATAPGEVRDDVATVLTALDAAREGDGSATRTEAFAQAVEGMATFRQERCQTAGGEGDQ